VRIDATKDQISSFNESLLWADIRRELLLWKKGFENERASIVDNAAENNPSTASVLLHMGDINGRIKAVEYMLSIPEMFLSVKESEQSKINPT
jgi:hypothetical protein